MTQLQLGVILALGAGIVLAVALAVWMARREGRALARQEQERASRDAADRVSRATSEAPATVEELSTRVTRGDWKLLIPLLLLLGGCAPVAGSCSSLSVREYSDAEQAVIVGQAARAPAELGAFVVEASRLRNAVRACRGD